MPHSALANPGATSRVLAEHDLFTRKSLGQHFLVDDNVVGKILALAALSGDEPVLEVGPGIGTLTVALCRSVGTLVAVERDERLLPVLAETTAGCERVRIVRGDAVRVPLDTLETQLGPPVALVANLPYAVAATVVLRFFEELPSLQSAVVMVQSEVADRMFAIPGTKQYGAYTVKLRLHAEPAGRFSISRTCFLPPPRVDSAVVRLDRVGSGCPDELKVTAAHLADAAFAQRRKTLRNSLMSALGADPESVDSMLSAARIDGGRRAETLSVEEYVELALAATRCRLFASRNRFAN